MYQNFGDSDCRVTRDPFFAIVVMLTKSLVTLQKSEWDGDKEKAM